MTSARPALVLRSGPARIHLLELFTSEGCSSCPPADEWLLTLRSHPQLWRGLVPVAFHVDYWDRLGWTDRLSSAAFSQRQRAYAGQWRSSSVYTPALVMDGREWRHYNRQALDAVIRDGQTEQAGVLTATQLQSSPLSFAVQFEPATSSGSGGYRIYAALCSNGVTVDVKAGENSGRRLHHEFSVVALEQQAMSREGAGAEVLRAGIAFSATLRVGRTSSVAFWVTSGSSQTPLQAVGGDL